MTSVHDRHKADFEDRTPLFNLDFLRGWEKTRATPTHVLPLTISCLTVSASFRSVLLAASSPVLALLLLTRLLSQPLPALSCPPPWTALWDPSVWPYLIRMSEIPDLCFKTGFKPLAPDIRVRSRCSTYPEVRKVM